MLVGPLDSPKHVLARRLRALRLEAWPGVTVTQTQLGSALHVSPPSISAWENPSRPTLIPASRLADVARFFATPRSVNGQRARLLDDRELTADEKLRREHLEAELTALRNAATSAAPTPNSLPVTAPEPLRFADGDPITIVCASIPAETRARMPFGDPDGPDYAHSYGYADIDALIELHGHLRATNPLAEVRIRGDADLGPDDLTTHLLLIGGVDGNDLTHGRLRIRPAEEGGFWVGEGNDRRLVNPVVDLDDDRRTLRADVAHLFRAPNPFNRVKTVMMFNGAFGRGIYGAVRVLTDARLRARNADYLARRFTGDTYSILARVPIVMGEVVTPDLTVAETRLYEWP